MLKFIQDNPILIIGCVAAVVIAIVIITVIVSAKKKKKIIPERQDVFKNAPVVLLGDEELPTETVKPQSGKADFSWLKEQ